MRRIERIRSARSASSAVQSCFGGRESRALAEHEDVLVLEDVEAARERAVLPQLLLLALARGLFEVLDDDALEREPALEHEVHRLEPERHPLAVRVLVADDEHEV